MFPRLGKDRINLNVWKIRFLRFFLDLGTVHIKYILSLCTAPDRYNEDVNIYWEEKSHLPLVAITAEWLNVVKWTRLLQRGGQWNYERVGSDLKNTFWGALL